MHYVLVSEIKRVDKYTCIFVFYLYNIWTDSCFVNQFLYVVFKKVRDSNILHFTWKLKYCVSSIILFQSSQAILGVIAADL